MILALKYTSTCLKVKKTLSEKLPVALREDKLVTSWSLPEWSYLYVQKDIMYQIHMYYTCPS